ncbi:hypothetical protein DPMN_049127 [Dreissena polymorpha]|uniref:Uncharacterized protein n=1 Tax=Dreissena polymorpha TaxID=45954 RepID=A0A9D4DCC0_DREPO|nr:hypothetical protein DPMN_049127 [Dreissena polymorpha]
MSDSEESVQTMPIHAKRQRVSLIRHNEDSGDDTCACSASLSICLYTKVPFRALQADMDIFEPVSWEEPVYGVYGGDDENAPRYIKQHRQDDVSSTVSTLQDDSLCDTPSSIASRSKAKKKTKPKPKFKCSNWVKVTLKIGRLEIHYTKYIV